MAKIKCRYFRPMCDYPGLIFPKKVEWVGYWWCDDSSLCERYKRPSECDPPNLVNPTCKYSLTQHCEFERDYKRYEYDESVGLMLGRKTIDIASIEYLEIDGRVLVDEEND